MNDVRLFKADWRRTRFPVLIFIVSLWAWKLVEFAYKESKTSDPLAPTPWGYVISLDVPVFATLAVGVVFVGVKVALWFKGKGPGHDRGSSLPRA